jgi:hypothetical protein
MKPEEIAQRRMHAHGLWGALRPSACDVVRFLGAMQAQEYPYARWSIAQRVKETASSPSPSSEAIDELLANGSILRTHILRPTWHFVLPEDIRWIMRLTAPRVHQLNAYYYRQCDLDAKTFTTTNKLLSRALEGGGGDGEGTKKTRAELTAILEKGGIKDASKVRLAYILMRAELDEIIVSGGLRGKQQTYASFESRMVARSSEGEERTFEGDEALKELTRRFFLARGPATMKDFARWSSLSLSSIKRGITLAGKELTTREGDDGHTYILPSAQKAPPETKRTKAGAARIDLVQGYDESVISYSDTKHILKPTSTTLKLPRGIYTHAILSEGHVAGHWRLQDLTKIESQLYRPLSRTENASLTKAVTRFAAHLGQKTLTLS